MAGSCEGGNEPPSSLKANIYRYDAVSNSEERMSLLPQMYEEIKSFVGRDTCSISEEIVMEFVVDKADVTEDFTRAYSESHRSGGINDVTLQRNKEQNCWNFRWLSWRLYKLLSVLR
ncbi:hypothetical protein ANN_11130 [Periplaneta americana]|uniref:Uncharacterized protein n=1 Tax=Periplaneta americana TaxID=6978 RepID=A0ABQ8T5C7_PERAM|nr:hypothetical protein ANN_11130 [Periplaneta americana]